MLKTSRRIEQLYLAPLAAENAPCLSAGSCLPLARSSSDPSTLVRTSLRRHIPRAEILSSDPTTPVAHHHIFTGNSSLPLPRRRHRCWAERYSWNCPREPTYTTLINRIQNSCLRLGFFPSQWKIAAVVVMPKPRPRNSPAKFTRPFRHP